MKQLDVFAQYSEEELDNIYEEIQKKAGDAVIVDERPIDTGRINSWGSKVYENPHIPGTKLDSDKPNLDLVLGDFSRALLEVGKVGTWGAKKHTEHGWLSVPNGYRRYQSALLRHNFYKLEEGDYDLESKLLHDAHRAWNALAALEIYLRDKK